MPVKGLNLFLLWSALFLVYFDLDYAFKFSLIRKLDKRVTFIRVTWHKNT